MDTTTAAILVVVLFAIIAVAAFFVFRQRSSVKIKGPFETGLELDASNDPPPASGVTIEDAKAGRNIAARDEYGNPVTVRRVDAKEGDVTASSTRPRNDTDPKA